MKILHLSNQAQNWIQNKIGLFTYTYISDGPLASMLEVSTKNESDLFYDKSILENGVEFIGLINKQGKMENILFKNDINLTKERKEMFSMELRLQSSMQSDFDSEFGPVNYTIEERKKLKFISIPVFSHIILAIMDKNIDHTAVINKIKVGIKNFVNVNKKLPSLKTAF